MIVSSSRPRLKENIWHVFPDAEVAYLSTSDETYEIPRDAALTFLRIRSHCTGHNDIAEISARSTLPVESVCQLLDSLAPSGIVLNQDVDETGVSPSSARDALLSACRLWGEELTRGYIGNQFVTGELPRAVLVGWLLEMYHYIKDFPGAIWHAQARATGLLQAVLEQYAGQESGHEEFVLRTLEGLGLSRAEVTGSVPLVSTRAIGFLMRSLVELDASAMLLIAALVEAQDFDDKLIGQFTRALEQHYGIAPAVFDPYFEHQRIDVRMGHAQLLENNLDLIDIRERPLLDRIVNDLHDLKHAFDLQGQEISHYYGNSAGRYVPRQPMTAAAIQ